MALSFKADNPTHDLVVYETFTVGGVTGLVFKCETCAHSEAFPKESYAKYRSALADALVAAKRHAGVDSLTWHVLG